MEVLSIIIVLNSSLRVVCPYCTLYLGAWLPLILKKAAHDPILQECLESWRECCRGHNMQEVTELKTCDFILKTYMIRNLLK